jgi:hypothetical protein
VTDWWQVLAWSFVLILLVSFPVAVLVGKGIALGNRPEPRASKRLVQLKERNRDDRR